jgi:hypothetical protein
LSLKKLYVSVFIAFFAIFSVNSLAIGTGKNVFIVGSSFPSQNYILTNSSLSATVSIGNYGSVNQWVTLNFYLLDSSGTFHLIDSDQFNVPMGLSKHVESGNIPGNLYSGYVDYYFTMEFSDNSSITKTYPSVFVAYSHQQSFNSITGKKQTTVAQVVGILDVTY